MRRLYRSCLPHAPVPHAEKTKAAATRHARRVFAPIEAHKEAAGRTRGVRKPMRRLRWFKVTRSPLPPQALVPIGERKAHQGGEEAYEEVEVEDADAVGHDVEAPQQPHLGRGGGGGDYLRTFLALR